MRPIFLENCQILERKDAVHLFSIPFTFVKTETNMHAIIKPKWRETSTALRSQSTSRDVHPGPQYSHVKEMCIIPP